MKSVDRAKVEKSEDWHEWIKKIPSINFKPDWNVKVIPPFGGAMARFRVEKDGAEVSVYLDVDDSLGCYGEPYWEVYPYDNDVFRVPMENTEFLIDAICMSLSEGHKLEP